MKMEGSILTHRDGIVKTMSVHRGDFPGRRTAWMKVQAVLLMALVAAVLTACSDDLQPVAPTLPAQASEPVTGAVPTLEPQPSATVMPTATPTSVPVPTDAPAPTATPKPPPTPEPTSTPAPTPSPAPAPTTTPTATPIPTACCSLGGFPGLAAKIQHSPWFKEDLSEVENSAIEWLLKLAIYGEEETADALIAMPFLEFVESDDVLALRAMSYPAYQSATYGDRRGLLASIINHPTLHNGITDDQTTLVVAAAVLRDADEIERMLNPGYADIETFSKDTVLTPHLKISIVRTGTPRQAHTAPALWNGLEFSERILQLPIPVNHVIVIMNYSAIPGGGGGSHDGFAVGYNPEFEQESSWHPVHSQLSMVHEMSHGFWRHGENWIGEGMAEMFSWLYAAEKGAGPGFYKLPRRNCEAHDLETLMEWNPRGRRAEQFFCYYYLGQRLFLELQGNVEPSEFNEKLRELYLLTRDTGAVGGRAGIAEVRQVFHEQSQIVEKHWSGKLNAPENRSYDEYRYSRYAHDLIQWDQYPTYDGQHVTLRGTLLRDAVLASGTLTEAEGGYSNFQLRSDDGQFIGNIRPPSSRVSSEYETVEYSMEGRTFSVKFAFPSALGHPQDYLVNVMGFLDESRTSSLFGSEVQTLGYARIRVK